MHKVHKPAWFVDGKVIVSNAPTCGINKDGLELYKVNTDTGQRESILNNELEVSINSIIQHKISSENHVNELNLDEVKKSKVLVPQYHDKTSIEDIKKAFKDIEGFELKSLGQLVKEKKLIVKEGHGSPSADQRVGEVPYIKVSDIRAGQVNINPSNMIPLELARKFWRNDKSNLQPYDLVSPKRASKNIGEFAVLLPEQTSVVLTKEVIIVRTNTELFDQFYLMWAFSLDLVREQWNRVVLMQTNREDVGNRINEIMIPVPNTAEIANQKAKAFKKYYTTLEKARKALSQALKDETFQHHVHLGYEAPDEVSLDNDINDQQLSLLEEEQFNNELNKNPENEIHVAVKKGNVIVD